MRELFNYYLALIRRDGFIGMDFNMAVCCIVAKRTGQIVQFTKPDKYHEKLEYWAGKRHFCHLHCVDEDDILRVAEKFMRENPEV